MWVLRGRTAVSRGGRRLLTTAARTMAHSVSVMGKVQQHWGKRKVPPADKVVAEYKGLNNLTVPAPTTPEMLRKEKRQDNEISRYVLVSTVRYPPTIYIVRKNKWIGNNIEGGVMTPITMLKAEKLH